MLPSRPDSPGLSLGRLRRDVAFCKLLFQLRELRFHLPQFGLDDRETPGVKPLLAKNLANQLALLAAFPRQRLLVVAFSYAVGLLVPFPLLL